MLRGYYQNIIISEHKCKSFLLLFDEDFLDLMLSFLCKNMFNTSVTILSKYGMIVETKNINTNNNI